MNPDYSNKAGDYSSLQFLSGVCWSLIFAPAFPIMGEDVPIAEGLQDRRAMDRVEISQAREYGRAGVITATH